MKSLDSHLIYQILAKILLVVPHHRLSSSCQPVLDLFQAWNHVNQLWAEKQNKLRKNNCQEQGIHGTGILRMFRQQAPAIHKFPETVDTDI